MSHVVGDHLLCNADAIMFKHVYQGTTYIVGAPIADSVGLIDRTTDSDTTLDSILTYLNGLGGGKLYVDSETYECDVQHNAINNLTVMGAGPQNTVFDVTGTDINLFYVGAGANARDDITFADFKVLLTDAPTGVGEVVRAFMLLEGDYWRLINIVVIDATEVETGSSGCYYIGNYSAVFGTVNYVWMLNCVADAAGHRNCGPMGLFATQTAWVDDCRFKGRDSDVSVEAAYQPCFGIYRIKDVNIVETTIELGHHNGIFCQDHSAVDAYYSENVLILGCDFLNNGDDRIDPNYDRYWTIADCFFEGNATFNISLEDDCTDFVICGNTVRDRQFGADDSYRIIFDHNTFCNIGETGGTNLGVATDNGCYDITITGNTIVDPHVALDLEDSTDITCTGNVIVLNTYIKQGLALTDTSRVTFISNTIKSESSGVRIDGIVEAGTSDYNIICHNIFYTPQGDDFYGVIVGANTYMVDNFGDLVRDQDGTMTVAGVGTRWTFDRQSGEVSDIDTAAAAGRRNGAVVYPRQYPTGTVPIITLTIKDLNVAARYDSLNVQNVTNLGFDWSFWVFTPVGGSTCDLNWKARPIHPMYD